MPTSNSEADKIVQISRQYLSTFEMKQLFTKLHEEVGAKTDNDSLKVSLQMMKSLTDSLKTTKTWPIKLQLLVVLHMVIVASNAVSFFILPFYQPWYICFPIMTFLWFFGTNDTFCLMTHLENKWRQEIGIKRIGGFAGHYIYHPVAKLLGLRR